MQRGSINIYLANATARAWARLKAEYEWVADNAWALATQPGWASAWDSAVATGIENPGRLETVISDAMILSAVQAIQGSA